MNKLPLVQILSKRLWNLSSRKRGENMNKNGQTQDFLEVYLSAYVEGSAYNKALEITNVTGDDVDLEEYTLEIYNNGETSPNAIHLSGTIENESVFVLVHPSADQELLDLADLTTGALNMNGDDVLVLKKEEEVVDRIGQVGNDQEFAKGVSFVRKNREKNVDLMESYDPSDYFEMNEKDDFSQLGELKEIFLTDQENLQEELDTVSSDVEEKTQEVSSLVEEQLENVKQKKDQIVEDFKELENSERSAILFLLGVLAVVISYLVFRPKRR